MGVILSAFLLPKMAFWGDLGSFEGSDGKKLYVRIAKTALGWQKMPFRGVRWGLGASHTSAPITLTWSGRRLRVFFIVSRGGSRHPLHVDYNFLVAFYNFTF